MEHTCLFSTSYYLKVSHFKLKTISISWPCHPCGIHVLYCIEGNHLYCRILRRHHSTAELYKLAGLLSIIHGFSQTNHLQGIFTHIFKIINYRNVSRKQTIKPVLKICKQYSISSYSHKMRSFKKFPNEIEHNGLK